MNAPKPTLNASTITRPRDIDGSRRRDGGSSGVSPRASALFSTRYVATASATAVASRSQVHHGQPIA